MTKANQAAFATGTDNWNQEGLTKREYFAAMAMQGLLTTIKLSQYMPEIVASCSVEMADALMVALNKSIDEVLRSATAQTKAEVYDVMFDTTQNAES